MYDNPIIHVAVLNGTFSCAYNVVVCSSQHLLPLVKLSIHLPMNWLSSSVITLSTTAGHPDPAPIVA